MGIKNDLIELCSEQFISPYKREYAGANYKCLFCGTKPSEKHLDDCPVLKYEKICIEMSLVTL